jgi:HEAT repeat protein
MSDKARTNARMLLILAEKDPVPALIKLLDDPDWKEKTLAMYELARLKDPRAIAPVARHLREAPTDYFHLEGEMAPTVAVAVAVEHSLEAIANPGTKESVTELIGLLGVDLSRFGAYIDRAGFQRIIAAYLIEISGESFGVDAAAWGRWEELSADGRR